MRLEAKGENGWRLQRGLVASGQPQNSPDPSLISKTTLWGSRGYQRASTCLN